MWYNNKMKTKKERQYKRCPRCGNKVFSAFNRCGKCELNFEKLEKATNHEGKQALYKNEKERVVWTNSLPKDLNKWKLFFTALFLGWTGAHLIQVGKLTRAVCHIIGFVLGAVYLIIFSIGNVNNFWYNFGNISGVFWLITYALSLIDIFDIAFNRFKVPVSLPYEEKEWKQ